MQKVPEVVLGPLKAKKMAEEGSVLVIKAHLIETEKNGKKKFYSVFEARYPDGRLAGWVTKATGQGYADKIELLLGLDPEVKNLTGLFILDQKETPGLGNKIIEKAWRSQFIKKGTDITLKVVKEGVKSLNEINAITGATISSKSVCNIINKSVSDLKGRLPLSGLKNKKEG